VLIEHDEEFYFITMHDEPLESPLNRTLKRLIDFLVALPVVFILLPLLTALVWVLQRMQSPGPVFYRQTRSGIQNEEFEILKFRTMHPHGGPASKQAEKNDGRIFPAGRWLRRFSLDEFPQFINVLRGQMSVIGPRPHLVEHNRQFADALQFFHSRTFIKPGITGLAQVRGFRGETKTVEDIKRRLESDLYYLENWSPMLDIGILLRTVWQVFFPPSTAY
jgi:lipopolysaccharide/colanic/teichoic acid biosynthesis glycosyltransferase